MPSLAAEAFTCDPSTEVFVGSNKTASWFDGGRSCNQCPGDIQTRCNAQGRTVSKIECNWWDDSSRLQRTTVCVGCCGAPLPPPITDRCLAGDADLSFLAPASRPWDCGKCRYGCQNKCEGRGETVSKEMCVFAGDNFDCSCCCRPLPPPPTPPPTPCPPSENTCDAEDMYLAFQLPSTSDCDLCLRDCKTKCAKLGSSVATECCIRKSSSVFCKCCCKDN
ncbi:hypothetical protein MKW92_021279 [Papaver armeniacum]|nr:hypothetical protein MKW92_021279 [Papaver armeniacum]